jgi:hypothetical protein
MFENFIFCFLAEVKLVERAALLIDFFLFLGGVKMVSGI